jgi:diketogulonate reductase-like aldo/keto reductase
MSSPATKKLRSVASLISPSLTLNNNKTIPQIGYGTYMRKDTYSHCGGVGAAVKDALDIGYRHLDCASFYANEKEVGVAIQESGVPREELFVTGKVWNDMQGYDKTRVSFEKSLCDLGIEYFDLFLVHWPLPGYFTETYRALEDLYKEGKVKSLGLSNFTVEDYAELSKNMTVYPVCNQIEVNPLLYRKDTIDFYKSKNIITVAYKPLGAASCLQNETIIQIASKYPNLTPGQLCIKWAAQNGLSVIPKSSNHGRMEENINIFNDDQVISDEDMVILNGLTTPEKLVAWRAHYESRRTGDPPKEVQDVDSESKK